MMADKRRWNAGTVVEYAFLIIMCIICVVPFVWTFFSATQNSTQIWQTGMAFHFGGNLRQNYQDLLQYTHLWKNMWNSAVIAIVYTVLVCIVDAMAGYAFAKFVFKGREAIFFLCMTALFIPASVTMIPLYIMMSGMKLVDSAWGVILPAGAGIFGVFFMRQSLMDYPDELLESARMDGASELRIFLQIVLPVLKPSIAALSILSFVQRWGDYLWPMIVLRTNENQTMPVTLALMITPGTAIKYGAVLLGACISLAPILILFLVLQKNFIDGMMAGALKG